MFPLLALPGQKRGLETASRIRHQPSLQKFMYSEEMAEMPADAIRPPTCIGRRLLSGLFPHRTKTTLPLPSMIAVTNPKPITTCRRGHRRNLDAKVERAVQSRVERNSFRSYCSTDRATPIEIRYQTERIEIRSTALTATCPSTAGTWRGDGRNVPASRLRLRLRIGRNCLRTNVSVSDPSL